MNSATINTARRSENWPCEIVLASMNTWSFALSISVSLSQLRQRLRHTRPPEMLEGGPGTRADAVDTARLDIGFLDSWT